MNNSLVTTQASNTDGFHSAKTSSGSATASSSSQSSSLSSHSFFSLKAAMIRFHATVVKAQLACPKDWTYFSIACFWVHFFQFSSIIVSFNTTDSTISWNEGWKVVVYLVRPVQYLLVEYNNSNQSINIAVIVLSFIFLFILALLFIVGSYLFETKHRKKLGFKLLSVFVAISTCFNYILCIPIHECLLLLLMNGDITANSDSTTIASSDALVNRICAVILAIFFQVFSYIAAKHFEVSYSLRERGLQRYSQGNLPVFLNHFRMLSILAYCININDTSSSMLYVAIVSCAYFIGTLYDYFTKNPFSCIMKSEQYLISLTVNFVFLICMIFYRQADVTSKSETICFIVIVCPVLLKFTIDIIRKMNERHLYTNILDETEMSSQSDVQLSRKIAMLANNQRRILHSDQLKFFGMYEAHKIACKKPTCFCKFAISKCHEDTTFLLNSDILRRYIRYLIRMELVFSNLNEKIHRLIFFIRYITCLSEERKHSFAISKLIDFINESDRMRKSYEMSIRVTIDTVLNILKAIMFENIAQIITDDEVEQQLTDIDLYIRMDNEKSALKNMVVKCIQMRIETFEKMRKNFEDYTELEDLNSQYNMHLDVLENRFAVFYDRYPTRQNQCFYIFFQAEVKGNLKRAIQISNTRKFISTTQAKKLLNVFGPNVLYLTATMGKIWGKIVNFSDKLPAALGYKKQEFNYVTHIKDIMPTSIATIHDEIIRCMMTQGNDAIINNQRQIFLKNKSNILIRVNVFIAMNLYYAHDLPFGVFVTPIETRSGFLFVTSAGYVEGLDQGILNQVGYNSVSNLPLYFQFKVQSCLPEFESYALIMETQNLSLFDKVDVPFNFFARSHPQYEKIFSSKATTTTIESLKKLQTQSSAHNFSEQNSSFHQSVRKMGSTQLVNSNTMKFKADITIERHKIRMLDYIYVYYIVEVKYLVRVASNEEFYTQRKSLSSQGLNPSPGTSVTNVGQIQLQQSQSHMRSYFGSKKNILLNSQEELTPKSSASRSRGFKRDNSDKRSFSTKLKEQANQLLGVQQPLLSTDRFRSPLTSDRNQTDMSYILDENNLNAVHVTERQAGPNGLINGATIVKNYTLTEQDPSSFSRAIAADASTQQHEQILDSSAVLAIPLAVNEKKHTFLQNEDELNSPTSRQDTLIKESSQMGFSRGDNNMNYNHNNNINHSNRKLGEKDDAAAAADEASPKKRRKSQSFNEREGQDLRELLHRDQHEGSVASSTDTLHRSLEKFNYYEEFIASQSQPFHLRMVRYSRVLEYTIILIATIASILTLYTSFDELLQNIDTLTLHSNILHPYANTILLSNAHYLLYEEGTSTQQSQMDSILMTRQERQTALFETIIREEWANSYLTSYFIGETMYFYEPILLSGYSQYISSILLQTSTTILYALNVIQYQFYLSERIFLTVNFQEFLSFFEGLASHYLADSISYNSDLLSSILTQTIILNLVTMVIFGLSAWNYYYFSKNVMSILKMCETATTVSVENEMHRFQKLHENLLENENILYNYHFSIYDKEKELMNHKASHPNLDTQGFQSSTHNLPTASAVGISSINHSINKSIGNSNSTGTKRKKLLVSVQQEKIKYSEFAMFIAFCYSLFVIFTLTSYILNTKFLNNFEPALKYYKQVSDVSYQISSLSAIRALLNEHTWLAATSTGLASTQYTLTNTATLKQFYSSQLDSLLDFDYNIFNYDQFSFFNDTLKSHLDTIITANICNSVDDKLDDSWSSTRCQSIHEGILTQGLLNAISKHYTLQSSFKQLGYVETLSDEFLFLSALNETYISITMTNYTISMRDQIKNSLSASTQSQKNVNLIIMVIFISLASIIYCYEIFIGLKHETQRFKMAKKIIFLVPLQTSMIEDTFIKILKAQSMRLEIIK